MDNNRGRGRGRRPSNVGGRAAPLIVYPPPPRPIIAGEPIVFSSSALADEGTCENFSTFIETVRERVAEEGNSAFGIPIMRAPADVNSPERYMKVIFEARGSPYTFYLDRSDLYVIGVNVGDTAYYFNDVREEIRTYLERDRNLNHSTLPFGGSYGGMLGFRIGLRVLDFDLYDFEKDSTIWDSVMLVAIQMISECARFQYLVRKIIKKVEKNPFNPDPYLLRQRDVSRQRSWKFNSTRIVRFCQENPTQEAPSDELMQELQNIDNVHLLGLLKPPRPE